jgi:hypothetical protein
MKDLCRLKFSPYSYFSRDAPRKVGTPCSFFDRGELNVTSNHFAWGEMTLLRSQQVDFFAVIVHRNQTIYLKVNCTLK